MSTPRQKGNSLEIEAKFGVPDEETFQSLLGMASLADFDLGRVAIAQFLDRYLDTSDRAARAQGYACRIRQQGVSFVATLKALGGVEGPIHRRAEYEVQLPDLVPLLNWPPGATRDRALRLFGQAPLIVLFEIKQTRHTRHVRRRERLVAELSLDRFEILLTQTILASGLELEVELQQGGTPSELHTIADQLQRDWRLTPQVQSKYERAMALVEPGSQVEGEIGDTWMTRPQ